VPTATSFRDVPAKLLEVNRGVINGYLGRTRGGKVSFTHLIGYAIVRAIADSRCPDMNNTFAGGRRRQARWCATSTSTWAWRSTWRSPTAAHAVVPVIRGADTLDFRGFLAPTTTSSAR
jgi:2-oxoglutarate decarboxylase